VSERLKGILQIYSKKKSQKCTKEGLGTITNSTPKINE